MINLVKFGQFIAEARKRNGLTQEELASQLGVTNKAVSKWENGRGLPDIELLLPLSRALHLSLDELLQSQRDTNNSDVTIQYMVEIAKERQRVHDRNWVICVISIIAIAFLLIMIDAIPSFECVYIAFPIVLLVMGGLSLAYFLTQGRKGNHTPLFLTLGIGLFLAAGVWGIVGITDMLDSVPDVLNGIRFFVHEVLFQ